MRTRIILLVVVKSLDTTTYGIVCKMIDYKFTSYLIEIKINNYLRDRCFYIYLGNAK